MSETSPADLTPDAARTGDPRYVVVTGGSRGIGFSIATTLVQTGYHVIVVARSDSPALRTAMHQQPAFWSFVPGDLAEIASLGQLAARVRRCCEPARLYGLVNNAGIGTAGILSMMPDSQIAQLIQLNVVSPLTLTKYLIRPMLAGRAGRVINIASIVASTGYPGLAVYSASKAALIGFTHSLAREVGSFGITVNAVAPGFIATEMTHGLDARQRQQIERRSALQRMASSEDVAATVDYLLSDKARNITGTVLTVDAGNTA